jgi:cytochrome c peroxidase
VPTLHHVAVTGPYCNGVFRRSSRYGFLQHARRRRWPAEVGRNVNKEELGNLHLTNQELEDVVAFLQTLTDGWKGGTR